MVHTTIKYNNSDNLEETIYPITIFKSGLAYSQFDKWWLAFNCHNFDIPPEIFYEYEAKRYFQKNETEFGIGSTYNEAFHDLCDKIKSKNDNSYSEEDFHLFHNSDLENNDYEIVSDIDLKDYSMENFHDQLIYNEY